MQLILFNGSEATFSGICPDHITVMFPQHLLKGIVEENIGTGNKRHGNNPRDLMQLPQFVWGDTDIMLGIKYLRYYPENCSSYHLDSQYTDCGSRMQMVLEVLVVVHIKCSQRLNPGTT